MGSKKILVIGSSNTDMTVVADRLPSPGETVLGGKFTMGAGGKGANQAVAAKRLGGNVGFVCKLGTDIFGDNAVRHYEEEGLDVSGILRCATPSGVALINVDSKAENSIVVACGANGEFTLEDVENLRGEIESADILLLQLEIPVPAVLKAAEIAAKAGVYVVLNPAPACSLPSEIYENISLIIPNETEAQLLTGCGTDGESGIKQAVSVLFQRGIKDVIITLGSRGSAIFKNGDAANAVIVPAQKVNAVDTTAAGDTFCGALCVALCEDRSLEESVEFATKASALTVQRLGAQESIPYRSEIN